MRNQIWHLFKFSMIVLLMSIVSFCSKEDFNGGSSSQFVDIQESSSSSDRVKVLNQLLPLKKFKSISGIDGDNYVFTLQYMVEAPTVNGSKVQASHIIFHNDNLYLSYNTAGVEIRGAYEVIKLVQGANPEVHAIGSINSEYNSVEYYLDPSTHEPKLMLAGIRLKYGGESTSMVQIFSLGSDGLPVGEPMTIDLNGFVATDINNLGVVTGTDGGFYTIHQGNLFGASFIVGLQDARSIAYNKANDQYVALLGNPGRLVMGLPGNTTEIPLGGLSLQGTKATVRVVNNQAFVALGDGGLKVINLTNSQIISSLQRPETPMGENPGDYVTNSVSVNEYGQVFIANGAAGIYVAQITDNQNLEVLGFLDLNASVNHVEAVGEYLFAASGDKGVAIIHMDGLKKGVPVVTTMDPNPDDITATTAICGGEVGNTDGKVILSKGICWSTHQSPSTADNKTNNGAGAGTFISGISGLSISTLYYVRAYAITSEKTYFGNERSFTTHANEDDAPTFVDKRDGKTYKTIIIGSQTWMAENLAWLPEVSTAGSGSVIDPYYYVYDYNGFSVEDAMDNSNYHVYGVLYNWYAAQNACPDGWHLPSDQEWKQLEKTLGMDPDEADEDRFRFSGGVGGQLKSLDGWYAELSGGSTSGFDAKPAGYRAKGGSYKQLESYSAFWTSDEAGSHGRYRGLYYFNDGVYRGYWYKSAAFSVRCIKD